MNRFYVYVYIHPEKGTPVYVGKGTGKRYKSHLSKSSNKILEHKMKFWRKAYGSIDYYIYRDNLTEDEALKLEEELISEWGTVVDNTGYLYNISKGGKGNSKFVFDEYFYKRLGKVTDTSLAEEYGASRSNISHIRRGLGINKCPDKPNYKPPPNNGGWNKKELTEGTIKLLGKMPDHELASISGCSKAVITRTRRNLSIKSFAEMSGNDGKFKEGSIVRMDKKVHHFLNKITGVGFTGTRLFFADYLGIHSGRVSELVKGRIRLLAKEWIYVGELT